MPVGDFRPAVNPVLVDASSQGSIIARDIVFVSGGENAERVLRQWLSGDAEVARQARRSEPASAGMLSGLKAFLVRVGQVISDGIERLLGKAPPQAHAPSQVTRDSGLYDPPWDTSPFCDIYRVPGKPSPGVDAASQAMQENSLYGSYAEISYPPALPARQGPQAPLELAYSVSIEQARVRHSADNEPIYEEIGAPWPLAVSGDYSQPYDSLQLSAAQRNALEALDAMLSEYDDEPIYAEPVEALKTEKS